MIDKNIDIECGWCQQASRAEEWEENTYKECITREMRRAYTSIYKEKAFKRKTEAFYKCPKCNKWIRGSKLKIVNTEDENLTKLGGEPIFEEVKDTDK